MTFTKDPNAVLDYSVDWAKWLDGDTIATSVDGAIGTHESKRRQYNDEDNRLAAASFDLSEEAWFARPERTRRASQRPTLPAPAVEGPIDSAIDGWFFDVATWGASGDPTG